MTTALYHAAAKNDLVNLKLSIKQGEDLNSLNSWTGGYLSGDTALNVAAKKGHVEAVSLLLAAGASANQQTGNFLSGWHSPLSTVVREILPILRTGYKTEITSFGSYQDGLTIIYQEKMHFAEHIQPKYDIAKMLIEHGATIAELYQSSLIKNDIALFFNIALEQNDVDIVKPLLEASPSQDMIDNLVAKGLDNQNISAQMMDLLIEQGGKVTQAMLDTNLNNADYLKAQTVLEKIVNKSIDPTTMCSTELAHADEVVNTVNAIEQTLIQEREQLLKDATLIQEDIQVFTSQGKTPSVCLLEGEKRVNQTLQAFDATKLNPVKAMKALLEKYIDMTSSQESKVLSLEEVIDLPETQSASQSSALVVMDVLSESAPSAFSSALITMPESMMGHSELQAQSIPVW